MTPDLKNDSSLGLTTLVTGIVDDAQTLMTQQLSLFQSEIKEDLGRVKTAAIPLLAGMAVCLLAGFFLLTMVVRLITDTWPDLPVYAANGIVGAVVAVLGGILVLTGLTLFDKVDSLSKKAFTGLKENVQWKTKN